MSHRTMPGFWVFAYGSLMWAPGFPVAGRIPARVRGWHRRFTLASPQSWGTPEYPGLCAALHDGGECTGLALRVGPEHAADARARLERREAAYRCREVQAEALDGQRITALTFVWNPEEPRFLPGLTICGGAAMIRNAGWGRMGHSVDYLRRTINILESEGFDVTCERLLLAAAFGNVRAPAVRPGLSKMRISRP